MLAPPHLSQYSLQLQERLPNARIVYCSATGVSEPRNMAFMSRLGLWGVGTNFASFNQYLKFLDTSIGVAELYAIHLKKNGQVRFQYSG